MFSSCVIHSGTCYQKSRWDLVINTYCCTHMARLFHVRSVLVVEGHLGSPTNNFVIRQGGQAQLNISLRCVQYFRPDMTTVVFLFFFYYYHALCDWLCHLSNVLLLMMFKCKAVDHLIFIPYWAVEIVCY